MKAELDKLYEELRLAPASDRVAMARAWLAEAVSKDDPPSIDSLCAVGALAVQMITAAPARAADAFGHFLASVPLPAWLEACARTIVNEATGTRLDVLDGFVAHVEDTCPSTEYHRLRAKRLMAQRDSLCQFVADTEELGVGNRERYAGLRSRLVEKLPTDLLGPSRVPEDGHKWQTILPPLEGSDGAVEDVSQCRRCDLVRHTFEYPTATHQRSVVRYYRKGDAAMSDGGCRG